MLVKNRIAHHSNQLAVILKPTVNTMESGQIQD